MLQEDEVEYVEEQIKETINLVERSFYNMRKQKEDNEWDEDFPGWTEAWIKESIIDLYYMIFVYLETR